MMDTLILTNHLGYVDTDPKIALLQSRSAGNVSCFRVVSEEGTVLLERTPVPLPPVPHWNTGSCWGLNFSPVTEHGLMTLEVDIDGRTVRSERFPIGGSVRDMRLINAAVCYFKASRATGEWEEADRHLTFRDGHREEL